MPIAEEQPSAPFRPIKPRFQITVASRENYTDTVKGLGLICAAFQNLESVLKLAIPMLIDPEDSRLGRIITTELSFKATMDLLYALHHYRFDDPEKSKESRNFLGECAKVKENRNRVIHSKWTLDINAGKGAIRIKHAAKNRKEFQSQRETLLPADMEKLANEINAVRDKFIEVWIPHIHEYELRRRDSDPFSQPTALDV